ncbi:hypothetical protein MXB_1692 [Myxobolus squamalis]|nr:hypothetical protein MXB_1692 [Myxobolus squamalis]
MKLILMTIFLK